VLAVVYLVGLGWTWLDLVGQLQVKVRGFVELRTRLRRSWSCGYRGGQDIFGGIGI
jgi:hypothetical protein